MVSFRQIVINQIKGASNQAEVAGIIEDSLQRLKIKKIHGHLIQRFIISMDIALSREGIEHHTTQSMQNVGTALDIIKRIQNPKAST